MHKLLYKLENKLLDIIKSYIKELNDSEDNNNENIKLLRKFCVEYFTKLDNENKIINEINKLGKDEDILLKKLFREKFIDIKNIKNKNQFFGNPFDNNKLFNNKLS